jgi:single-stranded-DNA-specific exonuclease
VELLDDCKDFFVRYGGHRQAAGFTIEVSKYDDFQKALQSKFIEKYGIHTSLPSKKITIECELNIRDIHIGILDIFQKFKPFWMANRKPIFLLKNLTLLDVRSLGQSGQHLSFSCHELTGIRFLCWRVENSLKNELQKWNIISPIVEFWLNEWNGKKSLQCTVISILSPE